MGLKNYWQKDGIEVGCDEAGRGCLAGPVVAAAVILDPKKSNSKLNDSKQLSKKKRDELRLWIEENALAWAVSFIHEDKIDEINILNASILGMHKAIDQLNHRFDRILVDGNRFKPYKHHPYQCMIKGDARFKSIAAASILAKTHRDEFMQQLHQEYTIYGWDCNMGYPTKAHRAALQKHGKSKYHRNSFKLLPDQLSLNF